MNLKHRQIQMIFQNWPIASNKGLWFSGEKGEGEFRRWVHNLPAEQSFYKGNKKHGKIKLWWSNGVLQLEGNYINGEKDGEWKHYSRTGQIEANIIFKKGERIKDLR